jgi:hypothetical protein
MHPTDAHSQMNSYGASSPRLGRDPLDRLLERPEQDLVLGEALVAGFGHRP